MCLAELEDHAVVVNDRIATAADAEIHRFVVGSRGFDRSRQLGAVRWRHHRQVGYRAHGGDVFGGVVRGAVEAQGNAGVVTDQPHRLRRVGNVHADLLAAQQAEERREGRHERHHAAGGQAGSGGDHVLLRDTELQVTLGVAAGELVQAVGILQIGGTGHHRITGLGQFDKRIRQKRQTRVERVQATVLPGIGGKRGIHVQISMASISAIARLASSGSR
ncbi:hypothetical protein D3C86_1348080 [compost metagenome]